MDKNTNVEINALTDLNVSQAFCLWILNSFSSIIQLYITLAWREANHTSHQNHYQSESGHGATYLFQVLER